MVLHEFYRVFFSISVKIVIGIFIEITLKSVDHPGNLNISTLQAMNVGYIAIYFCSVSFIST